MRARLAASVCVRLAVVAAFLAVSVHSPVVLAEDFEEEQRRYEEWVQRPSLHKRMDGRRRFAATSDPRALDILATSYTSTEEPENRVRHLLATLCTRQFSGRRHLERIRAWRAAESTPRDAWLWLESTRLQVWHDGPDAGSLTHDGAGNPWTRAACIEALAAQRHPRPFLYRRQHEDPPLTASLAAALLERAPEDRLARVLHLEACSAAITSHRWALEDPAVMAAAERLVDLLDDERTEPRTQLTVVRHLGSFLGVEDASLDAATWRRYLAAAGSYREAGGGGGTVAFAGLRATGTRIAYVIDASNSMCTPLTDDERKHLRRAITPRGGPRERKARAIDWDRVRTRFDAVREFLKISLRALPEGYFFSVILFGSRTEFLGDVLPLQEVSKASLRKATRALEAIRPGEATDHFPHGTLRGETNLHGGLRRAFLVRTEYGSGGLGEKSDGAAYVDPSLLWQGCDTIFVLSDGLPNTDDWNGTDRADPNDRAVTDRESKTATATPPELEFTGPYGFYPMEVMMDDVRRMNLFRRVEIHCVGVGDADAKMLDQLSRIGNGRFIELKPPE